MTKTLGTFWKKGRSPELRLLLWTWIKFHVLKVVLLYYNTFFFDNMILYLYTYLLAYLQDWSLLQKGQLWWPSALQPLWWTPAFKGRITTPRTYAKPNMRKVGQQQRKQSKLGMLMYTTLLLPKNELFFWSIGLFMLSHSIGPKQIILVRTKLLPISEFCFLIFFDQYIISGWLKLEIVHFHYYSILKNDCVTHVLWWGLDVQLTF